MEIIVFDIYGKYGHFKKPYSTASPTTFPFPPTSAVLGMIGAICGYGKNEYHQKIGWDKIKIAIKVINRVCKIKAGINHINVKNNKKGWQFFCNETHKPTNHEFLKNPKYRVYVAEAHQDCMNTLENQLDAEKSIYSTCLGLSECLAGIDFVGKFTGEFLPFSEYQVVSIVPEIYGQLTETNLRDKRIIKLRIPDKMNKYRQVGRYISVMYDDNLNSLQIRTDQAVRVNNEIIVYF